MMTRVVAATILVFACVSAQASDQCQVAYWNAAAVTALHECQSGAESGYAESQFGYGLVLWSGHGRTAQPKEAIEWFRSAARQGHLLARVTLGRMLSEPTVATDLRDPVEAYAWWAVAGERDAATKLRESLSPEQFAQAERMAQEFESAYGPSR